MVGEKRDIANIRIRRVTYLGAGVNLVLAAIKTAVGLLAGATRSAEKALHGIFFKSRHVRAAIGMLKTARGDLVIR